MLGELRIQYDRLAQEQEAVSWEGEESNGERYRQLSAYGRDLKLQHAPEHVAIRSTALQSWGSAKVRKINGFEID